MLAVAPPLPSPSDEIAGRQTFGAVEMVDVDEGGMKAAGVAPPPVLGDGEAGVAARTRDALASSAALTASAYCRCCLMASTKPTGSSGMTCHWRYGTSV